MLRTLPNGLPTPRFMLAADCADAPLLRKARPRRAMADLANLLRRGRGGTPLIRIRWKMQPDGSTEQFSAFVVRKHAL